MYQAEKWLELDQRVSDETPFNIRENITYSHVECLWRLFFQIEEGFANNLLTENILDTFFDS